MSGVRAEVMTREAPPRGIKRSQDDTLDDDHQRFTKRFHLLNIENHDKLYVPVPSPPLRPQQPVHPALSSSSTAGTNEYMQLDETKDRVYIHNLDDELASIESDDEKLIFLPDIEKRLNAIPKHILTGSAPTDSKEGQELVLYNVPSSLSVPEEQDGVRRAIIESRQRARERARLAAISEINRGPDNPEIAHGLDAEDYMVDEQGEVAVDDQDDDPDAMEIE